MRYKKYAALENSSGDPDSRDEAGRERHRVAPVYGYACCLNVVLTTGRLTWAFVRVLWWWVGRQKRDER